MRSGRSDDIRIDRQDQSRHSDTFKSGKAGCIQRESPDRLVAFTQPEGRRPTLAKSRFIAALVASYLTYRFGIRSRSKESLTNDRRRAFDSIKDRLVSIIRYCDARAADSRGMNLAPRVSDLPSPDQLTSLQHIFHLRWTIEEHRHLLPEQFFRRVNSLEAPLFGCAIIEITLDSGHSLGTAVDPISMYSKASELARECVLELRRVLDLPE